MPGTKWREENPGIWPDLREAKLWSIIQADHTQRLPSQFRVDLSGANLRQASLYHADLSAVDLSAANLSEANLSRADLKLTDLSGADLSGADLKGADLTWAKLRGADLTEAVLFSTIIGDLDLSEVGGLERVRHEGPSIVDINTIYRSKGLIPEVFLRGAGVPENFIEYMHSLTGTALEYESCFISYSSKDQQFADRLYADLQAKGVRCWLATEDLKIGDKFRQRIDEAIRSYDKLVVVLSKTSVKSSWVESEVWRQRYIGDFTRWQDHNSYQKAFARLLICGQARAGR